MPGRRLLTHAHLATGRRLPPARVLGRLDLLADQVVGFARATGRPELLAVAL